MQKDVEILKYTILLSHDNGFTGTYLEGVQNSQLFLNSKDKSQSILLKKKTVLRSFQDISGLHSLSVMSFLDEWELHSIGQLYITRTLNGLCLQLVRKGWRLLSKGPAYVILPKWWPCICGTKTKLLDFSSCVRAPEDSCPCGPKHYYVKFVRHDQRKL